MIEIPHQEFLDLRWGGKASLDDNYWTEYRTNPEDFVFTTTFTNDENYECLYYTTYPDDSGELVNKYYKYRRTKGEVRFVNIEGKIV